MILAVQCTAVLSLRAMHGKLDTEATSITTHCTLCTHGTRFGLIHKFTITHLTYIEKFFFVCTIAYTYKKSVCYLHMFNTDKHVMYNGKVSDYTCFCSCNISKYCSLTYVGHHEIKVNVSIITVCIIDPAYSSRCSSLYICSIFLDNAFE